MQIQFEHKRSSGSEFATATSANGAVIGSQGEYMVPNALSQQQLASQTNPQIAMMSSSHSTNWRGISSSEVKSVVGTADSISTRAYSAAVRALKPKGSSTITSGNGIIIPKVSLKKKSPH